MTTLDNFLSNLQARNNELLSKSDELKQKFDKFFQSPNEQNTISLGIETSHPAFKKFHKQIWQFFIDLYECPDGEIANAAIDMFRNHKVHKDYIYQVAKYFGHGDPAVRKLALHTMFYLPNRDKTMVPAVTACLNDPDPTVVCHALMVLDHFATVEDLSQILKLIGSDHADVRYNAAFLLKSMRKKDVKSKISEVEQFTTTDYPAETRRFARETFNYYIYDIDINRNPIGDVPEQEQPYKQFLLAKNFCPPGKNDAYPLVQEICQRANEVEDLKANLKALSFSSEIKKLTAEEKADLIALLANILLHAHCYLNSRSSDISQGETDGEGFEELYALLKGDGEYHRFKIIGNILKELMKKPIIMGSDQLELLMILASMDTTKGRFIALLDFRFIVESIILSIQSSSNLSSDFSQRLENYKSYIRTFGQTELVSKLEEGLS